MLENNASVKDMEAAAIAYVAELAGVPFFGVKVVTDIVDGDRPTQVIYFVVSSLRRVSTPWARKPVLPRSNLVLNPHTI
jgi:nucleoside phosphorylase